MRSVVVGAGAVGSRAARQLSSAGGSRGVVVVDRDRARAGVVAESLGPPSVAVPTLPDDLGDVGVVVLTAPGGQRRLAERALDGGAHVVSTCDDDAEVRALLDLDPVARERSRCLVLGAAFSPGLTCVLARHAARDFEQVDEIRVARTGSGGPACAASRQRALAGTSGGDAGGRRGRKAPARGMRDGRRELCWFPEPVGGRDCFPGRLPDGLLLAPAFAPATRITVRLAASRADRLASLPLLSRAALWLRRPRPEGSLGAVRVELRGRRGHSADTVVLGALDRPAVAAGTVAAVAAIWAVGGRLARPGAGGLAEMVSDPLPFLHELADRGVRAAIFDPQGAWDRGVTAREAS